MSDPKVLIFDIETFPLEVRTWKLGKQHVSVQQIVKDWSVAAWAAKWLGASARSTVYMDTRCNKDVRDDRNILLPMWKLLDEADIVITQNGKNFDSKKLTARFIERGMMPTSPYKHLDTYKIASIAGFTSHKLEYLTEKLCVKYKKLTHKRFPGLSLWDQCLAGNMAAWKEMQRYNIHDVLSTEELYMKLRPWIPKSMPDAYDSKGGRRCGACGKETLKKEGMNRTKKGLYQQWSCRNCGTWSTGAKIHG